MMCLTCGVNAPDALAISCPRTVCPGRAHDPAGTRGAGGKLAAEPEAALLLARLPPKSSLGSGNIFFAANIGLPVDWRSMCSSGEEFAC